MKSNFIKSAATNTLNYVDKLEQSRNWYLANSHYIAIFSLLLLSRLAYSYLMPEVEVHSDVVYRYLPSWAAVEKYWPNIFFTNGPLHIAYVGALTQIFGDPTSHFTLILQHGGGCATAMFVMASLRTQKQKLKINSVFILLFIVLLFNSPLTLRLEHSLLKENLVLWFASISGTLLVTSKFCGEINRLKFSTAIFLLFLCIFIRFETIILWALVFSIFAFKLFQLGHQKTIGISLLCPILASSFFWFGQTFADLNQMSIERPYGGSKFNIAYHYLEPKNFDYESEEFEILVPKYFEITKSFGSVSASMNTLYKVSEQFIQSNKDNPNYDKALNDKLLLMDRIFIDQLLNNKFEYCKTYIKNFLNVGSASKEYPSTTPKKQKMIQIGLSEAEIVLIKFFAGLATPKGGLSYIGLFLVLLACKGAIQKNNSIRDVVKYSAFITISYVAFLSFIANPSARFLQAVSFFYIFSGVTYLNDVLLCDRRMENLTQDN